jgi:hypothetical protein
MRRIGGRGQRHAQRQSGGGNEKAGLHGVLRFKLWWPLNRFNDVANVPAPVFGARRHPCRPPHFFLGSPASTKCRTADALVWPFFFAQASIARVNSGGIRMPTSGSLPVAGRPRFLGISFIDIAD